MLRRQQWQLQRQQQRSRPIMTAPRDSGTLHSVLSVLPKPKKKPCLLRPSQSEEHTISGMAQVQTEKAPVTLTDGLLLRYEPQLPPSVFGNSRQTPADHTGRIAGSACCVVMANRAVKHYVKSTQFKAEGTGVLRPMQVLQSWYKTQTWHALP